jgi:NAD(P) transhydrogenase subunit alpha
MLTTAAGTIAPARALVIGAGVAGLQAIATARRLGAVVEAFDTRPVVKEQVQSLGAKFLEVDLGETGEGSGGYAKELSEEAHRKEVELLAKAVKESDIIITTAAIPGRPAPKLISGDMVRSMKPGSVIVDLAAETGGNTELTQAGKVIDVDGVRIDGTTNLPSTMPYHASQMYSRNIQSLLGLMVTKEGKLNLDMKDDVIKGTVITMGGEVVHEQTKKVLEPQRVPA